ncbi:GYD domain-containing protein [Halegenticoccus tardaugens]|uniref:GYD domain-containing protein n=1 Tax=Halegenticoccus tardaugens TaxID=2071624 RepID=UPI00100B6A36|nr:GYD domain-containing protein [Halegenticoccus tardaugens]
MGTYSALVDVDESSFQNAQELATVWGEIRRDVEELGGELLDAYAVLGERDFLVLFEADDRDQAFKISIAMERYGLDTQTMEIIPVDDLGSIVEDF